MIRYFIITVDTEGDDQWNWKDGDEITTRNAKKIPKFQELCEKYKFKPVYLVNYEMAMNDELVKYLKEKSKNGLCEIGLHIHAWNSPPKFELDRKYNGNAYIVEYPYNIMYEKVKVLKDLLEKRFETEIVSHRSGRWSTNDEYFSVLEKVGIKIDCSVTPGINMSNLVGQSIKIGPDYSKYLEIPYFISENIIEVPMSTRRVRRFVNGSICHKLKCLLLGEAIWMRILSRDNNNIQYLKKIIEKEKKCDYIEFMLHSSELISGGNPYFKNNEDVLLMFDLLEKSFKNFYESGYKGVTLKEYVEIIKKNGMSKK